MDQGDTYDEALADVRSAVRFDVATCGNEALNGADVVQGHLSRACVPGVA